MSDRARPGERLRIGRRLYEIGNLDGSVSYFADYEEDGKQKRVKLQAWNRDGALEAKKKMSVVGWGEDAYDLLVSEMGQVMGKFEWEQNEELSEVLNPLYDQLRLLERDNRRLRREIERQKELRRERDKRGKDRRRERDRAKRSKTDPYIKLAKLDILAEEGATESERENARRRASELRGKLMSNVA